MYLRTKHLTYPKVHSHILLRPWICDQNHAGARNHELRNFPRAQFSKSAWSLIQARLRGKSCAYCLFLFWKCESGEIDCFSEKIDIGYQKIGRSTCKHANSVSPWSGGTYVVKACCFWHPPPKYAWINVVHYLCGCFSYITATVFSSVLLLMFSGTQRMFVCAPCYFRVGRRTSQAQGPPRCPCPVSWRSSLQHNRYQTCEVMLNIHVGVCGI